MITIPDTPRLLLRLDAPAGATREWTIEELRRLADRLQVACVVNFSGLPLAAFPGETAAQITDRFQTTFRAMEDAALRDKLTKGLQ